jgi:L-iditol 2-dehydrogenase
MLALRLHQIGDLRLHEETIPQPGPGEALVRVTAVGICGSDLHWFSEAGIGDSRLNRPLVLGHELAGIIESGPRRGQRVAVDPAIKCYHCEHCQEGNPNLCVNLRFAGHDQTDGGLQEYMSWPEDALFPLPDGLSDGEGAMLEPLGVALYAVDLSQLLTGMSVGVFGCGPIGLLIIQAARAAGATQIFATDRLDHRLEAAREMGADTVLAEAGGDESKWILEATAGRGLDICFEVAGENEAVEAAIASAKPGGRVLLVGIPARDQTSFTASVARRKGLTLQLVRRMKHTYPRAIDLVRRGRIDVRSLITHTFPLEAFEIAFNSAQRRDGLKVVIQMG